MGAIREELTLADRFSATFNRYLRFLDQGTKASAAAEASQRRIDAATRGAGEALVRMAGAALDAASAMGSAGDGASQLAGSCERASSAQDRMNESLKKGQSAASGLGNRLLSLAKAYMGVRSVQAFMGMTDTFAQTSARLDLVNEQFNSALDLQDMIYQSAQRSRASYVDTADAVAKMAMNAGAAFNGVDEVVAFMEQINKQFAIAGASGEAQKNAMIQLTQAMSAGVLRGEELNSILDQAPGIARAIEQSMGWAEGSIKQYAEDGLISAQVVKNAMFDMAEATNEKFASIPMTFENVWTMASSAAVKAMEPAMGKLNDLLNSDLGQKAVNGLISGVELLGGAATWVIDKLAAGAQWVADNWDLVSAVLAAAAGVVVALGARMALAGAVSAAAAIKSAVAWGLAHPQLVALIGLAAVAAVAAQAMGITFEDVFSVVGAGAGGLFAFGYNLVASAWNLLASFAEFFANFLDNPALAVIHLLADLADFALSILQNIAGAIDAVFGSNLAYAVNGWRNGVQNWADSFGEKKIKIARMDMLDIGETAERWSRAGAGLGNALDNFNVGDALNNFSGSGFDYSAMMGDAPDALNAIKDDTAAIKRSVALSEEDVKLLVDMAERQYVNNINLTAQTPVITINGQNTGDSAEDLQWLGNALQRILIEQAASHTDLSYQ